MTRRQYQLFALLLLIGAPALVSLLNQMLTGIHAIAPGPSQPLERPAYMQPAANPAADLPPALLPPSTDPMGQGMQNGQNAQNVPLGTAPMLDTSGIEVSGTDPTAGIDPSPVTGNPSASAPSEEGVGSHPEQ